jgi:carbon storage regulator CsrA
MLVLSRKSRESVVVCRTNDSEQLLRVAVLNICGGRVRLGFEANASIPVHRSKVWERIRSTDSSSEIKPRPVRPVACVRNLLAGSIHHK